MTGPPQTAETLPRLAVIVCSLDRRATLLQCLEDLRGQQGVGSAEVIVVDNGSSDGTGEMVEGLAADYPTSMTLVCEERRGLSIARNTGLERATAPVVVYVDDDVTFAPGWLATLAEAFEDESLDGAGGPIEPVFPPGTEPWFAEEALRRKEPTTGIFDEGSERFAFEASAGATPHGGNMALRRELALTLGGFREDLGWGVSRVPGEETNLFRRAMADGARVDYLPAARVFHHLDLERVNCAYARRWHVGYGRASIRMKGGESLPRRILRFFDQAGTYGVCSVRSWLPGGRRNLKLLRRRYQALGRMTEMVRGPQG